MAVIKNPKFGMGFGIKYFEKLIYG